MGAQARTHTCLLMLSHTCVSITTTRPRPHKAAAPANPPALAPKQTMLLKRLQEETDRQEAAAIERQQQRQAASGGGGGAMDVDGAEGQGQREEGDAGAAGADDQGAAEKPGMKQQDLVDWYMEMQINRWVAVWRAGGVAGVAGQGAVLGWGNVGKCRVSGRQKWDRKQRDLVDWYMEMQFNRWVVAGAPGADAGVGGLGQGWVGGRGQSRGCVVH